MLNEIANAICTVLIEHNYALKIIQPREPALSETIRIRIDNVADLRLNTRINIYFAAMEDVLGEVMYSLHSQIEYSEPDAIEQVLKILNKTRE